MSRWIVGPACDIENAGDDSFVGPAAGNSVLPGLPTPCRGPPPVLSPSSMWVVRSGVTWMSSAFGRSSASTESHPERSASTASPPSSAALPAEAPGAPRSTPRGSATRAAPAASREHHPPAPAARAGRSRRSRRQADLMPSARPHNTYSNHRNALILRPVTNQATSSPRPFPGP
jgi:hypothetical protein